MRILGAFFLLLQNFRKRMTEKLLTFLDDACVKVLMVHCVEEIFYHDAVSVY